MSLTTPTSSEPLPVVISWRQGESAASYLLRATSRNQLSLAWLRHAAGVPEGGALRASDSPLLAWLTSTDKHRLMDAFAAPGRWNGRPSVVMNGQTILRSTAIRSTLKPQLCPLCVRETGYCQLIWEFAHITVCPVHHVNMVDFCAQCGRSLVWDRPAIDMCRCMRLIGLSNSQNVWAPESLLWQYNTYLANRLAGEGIWKWPGVPAWLDFLSLDGVFQIVRAFGARPGPFAKPMDHSTRKLTTARSQQICIRGLERLARLELDRDLSSEVQEGELVSLAKRSFRANDTDVATWLLSRLFGSGGVVKAFTPSLMAINPRQLDLF
ncbi:TniQ family protein [Rhodoferax sediminis]|nr:TniQ family protein [Rhodoferax sediminis]